MKVEAQAVEANRHRASSGARILESFMVRSSFA